MQLQCTAAVCGGCADPKRCRTAAEIHARNLDIFAVLNIADISAALGAVFGLDAGFPADCFRFCPQVGIQCFQLRRPLFRACHLLDFSVCLIGHLLDAHGTCKAAAAGQCAGVIGEIRMPLIVDDAGVICEAVAAVLHDDTAVFPGPRRAFAHRISDVFGDAVRRIDHIIPVTVLVEIGRFGVLGTPRVDLDRLPLIGDHISVELHHPELWVAPVEICLPVIIHKHSGVNIAPVRAAKRLANRVGERPFRAVCNSNADRSAAAVCRSHGHIIIEFAVTLDALCRPRFSACPLKGCIVQRNAEVCPVLHIRG